MRITRLRNVQHLAMFLLVGVILSNLFYSCKYTNSELIILYNKDFDYVKNLAEKEGKVFCIVSSRPDCPPCKQYVQSLGDLYSNVIIDVVDIYLPENQWYMHWLCSGASPNTIVFSPKGKLKAIATGIRGSGVQCIQASISGDTECAEYFYDNYFSSTGEAIPILNALLFIKQKIDKGEDVSHAIDSALNQSEHPYVVYLKSLNEAQQGRHESSIYWANLFLSTIEANSYYFQVYGNLIGQAKMTADPNYALDKDGELSVVGELSLGDCKLHEARPFGLMITNKGQSPLFIHDIVLGCTCVEFSNEKKQYTLQPMQSQTIDFVFKADVQGEIFREIMFFSNGINPVERVQITATVK